MELIEASKEGNPEVVKKLIEEGADLNAKTDTGFTALLFASLNGHEKVVDILCKAGANLNATTNKEFTALMLASLNGHKKVVDILCKAGASVIATTEKEDNDGEELTALMIASGRYGVAYPAVVKTLIDYKADVNMRAARGYTALMDACVAKNMDVVRLLIDKGANRLFKNDAGQTAYDVAVQHSNNPELIALVKQPVSGGRRRSRRRHRNRRRTRR